MATVVTVRSQPWRPKIENAENRPLKGVIAGMLQSLNVSTPYSYAATRPQRPTALTY